MEQIKYTENFMTTQTLWRCIHFAPCGFSPILEWFSGRGCCMVTMMSPNTFLSGFKAPIFFLHGMMFFALWGHPALGEDTLFSGPQKGETATPFQAVGVREPLQGKVVEVLGKGDSAKYRALIFVHGLERSMAPLMRIVDAFGNRYKEDMQTDWVFLSDDLISSRQRLPMVARSLQIKGRMLLSEDGLEGPGNYGLNKQCLLTLLALEGNLVVANHAWVQPGIADADDVLTSLATHFGFPDPPSAESLSQSLGMDGRNERSRAMRSPRAKGAAADQKDGKNLPGAVPEDASLVAFMRAFIQPSNSNARVDEILEEVNGYIGKDKGLMAQAIGGWTRLLHVRYGTAYAQEQGALELKGWKKALEEEK